MFGITGEATFVHFLQSLSLNFKGLLVSVCQVSSVCLSQFCWSRVQDARRLRLSGLGSPISAMLREVVPPQNDEIDPLDRLAA